MVFKLGFLRFFALFIVVAGFATPAFALVPTKNDDALMAANIVNNVQVSGNRRIEPETIVSYLGLQRGDSTTQYDIDNALRALYATGFFADVSIKQAGDILLVNVAENPMVNRITFEGNERIESKDLEKEIQLKERSIYTRTKIQADLARILELYRRKGRYSAIVVPKVIERDQNRVDVVYEVQEGDVTHIEDIAFIGNTSFSASTLRDVIRSSNECWYCFLSDNDKYDPDRLQFDRELLRKFYTSQGFADFKVTTALAELTPDRKSFHVTFSIEEGPKYNIGKVEFSSALQKTDTSKLKDLLTTKEGDIYDAGKVESSVDAIVKELGNQGFAFVDVNPETKNDTEAKTINLDYQIKEGSRVYIERINITGNQRTIEEVVRREFRFAEGDPYNTSKVQRTEQRLKNLGFFEKVTVTTAKGSAPDRVIVNVEVLEKSTGEISLGAGYSTTDGVLGDFGIREKNLLGKGQDLRFKAMLASKRQEYDIGFTEPYFLNREIAAGFDVFNITQNLRTESSFDRKSTGGRLRAGYAVTEDLSHSVNYSIEKVDITNIKDTASRFIKDQDGQHVTSLVGHALTYDKRDNVFDPSSGYYLKLGQDFAGLGGDSHFIRHTADVAYYYSFVPQWTMMLAGTGGEVEGLDGDVRIYDRFFVGSREIRGFANAGIGPRDIKTKDALGGNLFYVTTAELNFPLGLPDDLGFKGAIFVDAGSLYGVDDSGIDVVDSSALRASAGVGVTWKSPFGPIRLDFSNAFKKQKYDETEIFRFNFGTKF